MTSIPETQFAQTSDGVRLAYQVIGDGPADIVLLPGWAGAIDLVWEEPSFAHALNRLAAMGRLIVLDLRGFGASDRLPVGTNPTPEAWMEDVGVVMDAVRAKQAAVVAGGIAGLFGMLFAATHPARTSALVLVNSSPNYLRDGESPFGASPEDIERMAKITERHWGTGMGVEALAPSRSNDAEFRGWFARWERLSISAREFANRQRWVLQFDMRPFLPSIQAPTLILNRKSRHNPHLSQAEYMAEHIPNAKLIVPPGIDPLFCTDQADPLLDDVEEFLTGIRPVPETDRVLATVLFTDIVDSTRKQAELGDAGWKEKLDRHDELVRREIGRHRGRQVKTTGDGVLATFDGPARAVRCTQAIVRGLASLGLEARAGLHTGEVESRGEDVTGLAVTIGRRVSDLAGAGEILVSRTVTDLVAGSGIEFDDRGEHELKGVPGNWKLFGVRA